MKKIFKTFYPVIMALFLTACMAGGASKPVFSDAQRRAMQVRTHDASYDMTFHAVKSVLLDDGYIIKSQDYAGGMILAEGSQLKLPTGRANPSSTGTADEEDGGVGVGGVLLGIGVLALAVAAGANSSPSYHSGGGGRTERQQVGTSYQISFNFDKINKTTTETRLIVQERSQYNMGNETLKEHIKPEIYKHLYDRIAHEIKRREAMGR
ncbi:MAG: hypothetical protein JW812_02240 [Alphaproteobacteria bacterium]|nr:hypothetical protein [Alphaproteobacteria bacterium]MBN2779736.1 hypothetical protein [Alphaproteobacteria bacterium]